MNLNLLEQTLSKSWGKSTCYPGCADQWDKTNPSFGQCAITALIVQDYYGGELLYCNHNNHFWNKLPDGKEIDLTKKQFPDKTIICMDKIKLRKNILKSHTKKRYLILKNCVKENTSSTQ